MPRRPPGAKAPPPQKQGAALFFEALFSMVCTPIIFLRELTTHVTSTVFAWCALAPSAKAFVRRQERAKKRGTKLILDIQSYRTPFLDKYFMFGSFCAEEDFYLIVLPVLFWNVDHHMARTLTFTVCLGLGLGNYVKDLYLVPRPKGVWVPQHSKSSDSTALRDFGFPSTHSLNGLTNPAFLIAYYVRTGVITTAEPYWAMTIGLCGLVWLVSLSFGRMYLGVHSPSDVEGGLVIGAFFLGAVFYFGPAWDEWVTQGSWPFGQVVIACIAFMLLSPQPRPRNPTFIQNVLVCGLVAGNVLGSNLRAKGVFLPETMRLLAPLALAPSWAHVAGAYTPWVGAVVRTVVGYAVVLLLRIVAKTTLSLLVKAVFGVKLGLKTPIKDAGEENLAIGLEAFAKFTSYTLLAWSITHGVPLLIRGCNLDIM